LPPSTRFPYTTLFRSLERDRAGDGGCPSFPSWFTPCLDTRRRSARAGGSLRPQHGHGAAVTIRHLRTQGPAQRDGAADAVAQRAPIQDRTQGGASAGVGELDRDLHDRAVPGTHPDALAEAALGEVHPLAVA